MNEFSAAEDSAWHAKLPQLAQKIQMLPDFPCQVSEVIGPHDIPREANAKNVKCSPSLHLSLSNVQWWVLSSLSLCVNNNVLHFASIKRKSTVVTPLHKASHLAPVCWLITPRNQSNRGGIVCKCNNEVLHWKVTRTHIAKLVWPISGPHNARTLGTHTTKNDGSLVAQIWIMIILLYY